MTLERKGEHLLIDFSGTGAEHDGNLNAPRAVTMACVLYFLRLLVNRPIPLNGGCLRHVTVHVPPRCLLDPGRGAGAGALFDGASGVHTHMTNTRITDAEILERRFPVRLWEHSLLRGSGGRGRRSGGDGVKRVFEFLEPTRVSLLSQRRTTSPFGLMGGSPGVPGRNQLNDHDLPGATSFDACAGDRLTISTPGGGCYGSLEPSALEREVPH